MIPTRQPSPQPIRRVKAGWFGLGLLALVSIGGTHAPARSGDLPPDHTADKGDSLLWIGIDAMYSYRFAQAQAALDSVIARDPDNPVAPFVAASNRWLRALTEQGVAESYEALLSAVDVTIPHYKAMLRRDSPEAEILLFLGTTYGLRARVAIAQKRWTSVIYSGLKGVRLVQRAHRQDSTLADAWLPIGIFDYYAGASSRPVQILARMFGIRPDRQLGIAELDRAVRQAPHAWIEAASTLSILYLYIEDNPQAAYRYTSLLMDHYPDNYYFNFLYGEELVRTHRLNRARQLLPQLQGLVQRSHPNQRLEWKLKYAALEAALAWEEGDPVLALERAQWAIDNYEMEFDWHLGQALYLRATIREGRGDLAGAREDFRAVVRLDNGTWVIPLARTAVTRVETRLSHR